MFDVWKRLVRIAGGALAAGMIAGMLLPAQAQQTQEVQQAQAGAPVPDTNSTREARIARTIEDTYSHRWEVFGGGGWLRFRSGEDTRKASQVSWAVTTSYYLNRKLFVMGQAQGSFGYAHVPPDSTYITTIPHPQINEYFFLGGAGYRFYSDQKFAISADALGGGGWGIFSGGSKGLPSTDLGIWQDGTRAAVTGAVNFDYNIYPDLALRLSPYYMATTFTSPVTGGSFQNNVGFNAGVLFRFGRR